MCLRLRSLIILALAATSLSALERISPVRPPDGVSPEIRQVFDEYFKKDIRRVLATADMKDDSALVKRIFEEASKRNDYPEFAAHALDQVVRLGSICPDRQTMVYTALKIQKTSSLRPARPCLEKMMIVAARVAEQSSAETFAGWFTDNWAQDAMELAELYFSDNDIKAALSTVSAARDVASRHKLVVPSEMADHIAGLEFLCELESARKKYEGLATQTGFYPKAHVFLGVVKLLQDGDQEAGLKHLRQSKQSLATDLAAKVERAASAANKPALDLQLAQSMVALAGGVESDYLKLLLHKGAVGALAGCLADPNFQGADRLRAEMLNEKAAGELQGAVKQLPTLARERLFSGAQQIGEDGVQAQDFFGIPLGDGKRVVYVVDRGSSMTDSIMYVKAELSLAISSLQPSRRFQIVFYSSGSSIQMPGTGLVPASIQNKEVARRFIGAIAPVGLADPSDALRKAFLMRPDTVYLLTGGEVQRAIIKLVDRLNPNREVRVNTICLTYGSGQAVLQTIALRNFGAYKFVDKGDLENLQSRRQDKQPSTTATLPQPMPTQATGMPKAEEQKLSRVVEYLIKRRICMVCRGQGNVDGIFCKQCNGTGRTPREALRPSMEIVKELLAKHGTTVPPRLRSRAEKVLEDIKAYNIH